MKLLLRKREQGSVLVIILITGLAIGVVLASFLTLISSRHKLTVRSMGWNAAMPVLEAGIEEALAHLHKDSQNPSADGWAATTVGGQPVNTKKRTFSDGSYYSVAIYNARSNNPTIYSSGFIPSPLEKGKYISRLVRVGATNPPNLYVRAITTSQQIKLGGSVMVDGFDSTVGRYNVSTNRHASGGIATNSKVPGAVDVGNANVYGTVTTGPGGTVDVGSGGSIGDVAWNASHNGIQPGATNNDFNAAFPSNAPPSGSFVAPVTTAVGGSNIMYLTTGTNKTTSLSFSKSTDPMIVTGNATLWLTGDLNVSGNGAIVIMPGASLTLYVGGEVDIGGGGVLNDTGLASQFTIIGLASNKSISFGGNSTFVGRINAPQADVKLNGTPEFYGASISQSFTSVGTADFHYDEALGTATVLVVTSWKEL
jgi:hypothetical protein